MKSREVLVIGAGIAGCAVALALAKKGIAVTIVTSSLDQRAYHASFIQLDDLEKQVNDLQQNAANYLGCSRALEQFSLFAKKSINELIDSSYLLDKRGNIDIHRCLQEQLKQIPHVEWMHHCSVIELLTLEKSSIKSSDLYKKNSCLGAYVYNYTSNRVETFLAKEVILATGGATSLFLHSTHSSTIRGDGLAIAYRAGARLLNMGHIEFHPLALFEKEKPCFPLPIELLVEGGKLYAAKNNYIENHISEPGLASKLYRELFKYQAEHLWLDLTALDPLALKDKFPLVDAYCLAHGFNIAKDPLPVVPVAQYTCGGIAVDRVAQTTVHRLRAVGEVACTGLVHGFKNESMAVLESLTWSVACADDISKQLSKFIYYFPEVKEWEQSIDDSSILPQEDWRLLRQIMWYYVGIIREPHYLKRGYGLLEKLKSYYEQDESRSFSIDHSHFFNALETALLMAQGAWNQVKTTPSLVKV